MLFRKQKKDIKTIEKENALQELLKAKAELERVKTLFNFATDDYFEIANNELIMAEMRYNVSFMKLRKLCEDGGPAPQMSLIHSYITAF